MDKIVKACVFIFLSAYILLEKDVAFIGTLYFYIILIVILYDVISTRKISLLSVWNFSFLFIINAEVLSSTLVINYFTLPAVRYLVICNCIINLGYLSNQALSRKKSSDIVLKAKKSKFVIPILIFLIAYYCVESYQSAISAFTIGRAATAAEGDGNFIFASIINALGYVLPAICAYYFIYIKNTNFWKPLIFSVPIFIILFLGGTRFPLLFSLLGFIIVIQSKNMANFKVKNYMQIILVAIILLFASDLMKSFRTGNGIDVESVFQKGDGKINPVAYINSYFSPEGIVDMTSLMFRHFGTHSHLYGSSSSFLLYFWVPREIWPDKPTMLGYWFIREYRGGFGSGHSASFGFSGDLYADFGLFSVIFIFFLGRLLKTADNFKSKVLASKGFDIVLGAMIFPYVFFFIRSPITSSINFIGVLFFYFLLKKLIFRKLLK